MSDGRTRHAYIDWARGLAVLIMIEAHTLDSWTRAADRRGGAYAQAMILAGFAAPLFLFLAGVGAVLSAESKRRRSGDVGGSTRAVARRGWEILGLAFLFRLQALVVSAGSSLSALLKVDILNVMGPAVAATALVWGAARHRVGRLMAFAGIAAATAMLTPIVRTTRWLDGLADPLESYLRPMAGRGEFALFPWAGFVFAGAAAGLLVDLSSDPRAARRAQVWLASAGVGLAALGYATSLLPSIYDDSSFWTSSPTFFCLRVGLITALLPLAYLWNRRPRFLARSRWSPVEELGRSSLFVYWIHVDIAYGLLTRPLHRSLTLAGATVACGLFCLLMLAFVIIKNELVARWKARPFGGIGGN